MTPVTIFLESSVLTFYKRVAEASGYPLEHVLSDALFKLAGELSLEALHRHHAGVAGHVSREMLTTEELAAVFAPWFAVDVTVSDEEKYIVSGVRREEGETT